MKNLTNLFFCLHLVIRIIKREVLTFISYIISMEGFKQQEYSPIEKKYSTLIESELKSPRVVEAQHKILEIFVKKPELITAILESFGDSEFMKRWNEGRR